MSGRTIAATGSFELSLEEHPSAPLAGGYNPYDTFPSVRPAGGAQQNADLRRLSEWIRLKRQVAQIKKTDKYRDRDAKAHAPASSRVPLREAGDVVELGGVGKAVEAA